MVREKTHSRRARWRWTRRCYEMELVGHDFYLFVDADTGLPSVVYRRHGYDYGVIHLKADGLEPDDELGGAGRRDQRRRALTRRAG